MVDGLTGKPAQGPAGRHDIRLGYAMNAFSYETASELLSVLDGPLSRIRSRLPGGNFPGLELRLGIALADELLADPQAFDRLSSSIEGRGLAVLTMNGFSPQGFHGRSVKEDAYRPTWEEEGRAAYTRKLAELFARLLPESGSGAISTSPGSFKLFGHDASLLDRLAEAYAGMAAFLHRLEEQTGRTLLLCIEPEPGCSIETTDELIEFFRNRLARAGRERLTARGEMSRGRAEELLHRHIAMTFDTAHQAVEFEDPVDALRKIEAAGIRIGKLHATSAIRVAYPAENPEVLDRLEPLRRSPYMHQLVGIDEAGRVVLRAEDFARLPAGEGALGACREVRIHFHLPLFLESLGPLQTTRSDTEAAVSYLAERGLTDVVVLETYTWGVLRLIPEIAEIDLEEGVTREIGWAREHLMLPRS